MSRTRSTPAPKPADSESRYLVRFDYARVRGWQVRLPKWHPRSVALGREYTEFFSDGRCSGASGALRAARMRRDELMRGLPLPNSSRPVANTIHPASSSGLVGVTLAFRSGRAGETAFFWKAVWREPHPVGGAGRRTRQRSFAVSVYGFQGALHEALKQREKHTGLKFTPEQRVAALDLYRHVDRYCRTGKAPMLAPRKTQLRAQRARAVKADGPGQQRSART